ncbi:MAG: YfhO family protein, partial [Oscillospiraceae bacterium]|nr:YfhO family protein [Oscillospiraceae bacterium]
DVYKRQGNYNITRQEGASGDTFLKYNYTMVQDGMAYAMMKVTEGDNMDVYFENEKLHSYNIARQPYITPVGSYKAGDVVTLRCNMDEDGKNGTAEVYMYQLNEKVFQKGYEILKSGKFTLTSFSDTKLTGEVTAQKDGCLYLSVPYEEGWTMYVDGEKADMYAIFDAMCAVNLTAGTHTIEMRYAPKGFAVGVVITIGSVAVLVVLFVLERKKKKNEKVPVTVSVGAGSDTAETKEVSEETSEETGEAQNA